jgi:hypothetical protein
MKLLNFRVNGTESNGEFFRCCLFLEFPRGPARTNNEHCDFVLWPNSAVAAVK